MKLSKQERIGVIIILVIVVLGLGIWLMVVPKIEAIGNTSRSLESKQNEYKADLETQAQKVPLRKQIEDAYDEGEHLADMFFPEMTSYESDAAFREFIQQCKSKVLVESLTVGDPTVATLGTQFYTSPRVEYDLKTYATQGTTPSIAETLREARQLVLQDKLGGAQTIGASTVTFTVYAIDRDEILNFIDEINNYRRDENGNSIRKAIKINGLTVEYTEISQKYEEIISDLKAQAEKDGQQALQQATGRPVGGNNNGSSGGNEPGENEDGNNNNNDEEPVLSDTLYQFSDTMTFYCIERMQDPKTQLDAQDGTAAA